MNIREMYTLVNNIKNRSDEPIVKLSESIFKTFVNKARNVWKGHTDSNALFDFNVISKGLFSRLSDKENELFMETRNFFTEIMKKCQEDGNFDCMTNIPENDYIVLLNNFQIYDNTSENFELFFKLIKNLIRKQLPEYKYRLRCPRELVSSIDNDQIMTDMSMFRSLLFSPGISTDNRLNIITCMSTAKTKNKITIPRSEFDNIFQENIFNETMKNKIQHTLQAIDSNIEERDDNNKVVSWNERFIQDTRVYDDVCLLLEEIIEPGSIEKKKGMLRSISTVDILGISASYLSEPVRKKSKGKRKTINKKRKSFKRRSKS